MRQTTIAAALLFLLPLLPACGGCSSKHGSPEAAFEAMQDAAQEKDWETAAEQMTAPSQSLLVHGLLLALGKAASENKDEIESLLKRHRRAAGEDTEPVADSKTATALTMDVEAIQDKPKFVADAISLLETLGKDGSPTFASPSDKLENLKIDGDSATAVIVTDSFRVPIEFRRVDGGWLIHISGGQYLHRRPATRTALDVLRD